jgi:hypothetical protein
MWYEHLALDSQLDWKLRLGIQTYTLNAISIKGQLISKCPFGIIVWTKYQ